MTQIIAVAAMTQNGHIIGKDNWLPWDIPEELAGKISRVQLMLLYSGPGHHWRFANSRSIFSCSFRSSFAESGLPFVATRRW